MTRSSSSVAHACCWGTRRGARRGLVGGRGGRGCVQTGTMGANLIVPLRCASLSAQTGGGVMIVGCA